MKCVRTRDKIDIQEDIDILPDIDFCVRQDDIPITIRFFFITYTNPLYQVGSL